MKELAKGFQRIIQSKSNADTKNWFENYLKGSIKYRGVKTPEVRKELKLFVKEHELLDCSTKKQLSFCMELFASKFAEDKFAAIIFLQDYMVGMVPPHDILDFSEKLFKKKLLFDWSTTDWFCVRVLDKLVVSSNLQVAKRIAGWRKSDYLWQRRASVVPFRGSTKDEKRVRLALGTAKFLVKEEERFIQTGIGWVLSDLSKVNPGVVNEFFLKYMESINLEIFMRHTKYLKNRKQLIERKKNLLENKNY